MGTVSLEAEDIQFVNTYPGEMSPWLRRSMLDVRTGSYGSAASEISEVRRP